MIMQTGVLSDASKNANVTFPCKSLSLVLMTLAEKSNESPLRRRRGAWVWSINGNLETTEPESLPACCFFVKAMA